MKFSAILALLPALAAAAAIPKSDSGAQVTPAPSLVKRDSNQKVLTNSVWTSTSEGAIVMVITPTVIDGVTISASPVTSSATPWNSLDSSGIPYLITPTVSDGTTVSTSPTPTDSSYPTATYVPPVLRCFGDRVPSSTSSTPGYPFCTVTNGTEMIVGETYWITWDPTYWGGSDVTQVYLEMTRYPQTGSNDILLKTEYISNSAGYYPLEVLSNYEGYFFLSITPLVTSGTDATNTGTKTGPVARVIASKSDASSTITRVPSDNGSGSSSSTSKKVKTIVPAVVVPVVVVGAVAAAIVIYYFKKYRNSGASASGAEDANIPDNATLGDKGPIHILSRANTNASLATEGTGDLSRANTNASLVTEETGSNPFNEANTRTVL